MHLIFLLITLKFTKKRGFSVPNIQIEKFYWCTDRKRSTLENVHFTKFILIYDTQMELKTDWE